MLDVGVGIVIDVCWIFDVVVGIYLVCVMDFED